MDITIFFEKDLDKLIEEITLFKNEEDVWIIKDGINNSAGNLTTHLLGNLNHFIGKTLGNSDYVRKRDEEFSIKNISRDKLISDITALKIIIKSTLAELSEVDLKKTFPLKIMEQDFTTGNMLIFLLAHLNYHLGQINYLRRLL